MADDAKKSSRASRVLRFTVTSALIMAPMGCGGSNAGTAAEPEPLQVTTGTTEQPREYAPNPGPNEVPVPVQITANPGPNEVPPPVQINSNPGPHPVAEEDAGVDIAPVAAPRPPNVNTGPVRAPRPPTANPGPNTPMPPVES